MSRSTSEMVIQFHETIGDVPPRLIGASAALFGSRLYLFGGSMTIGSEQRVQSDLYVFDLELWKWEKLFPAAGDPVPKARCFHTTDIWKNYLVLFGGVGARDDSTQSDPELLQDLNDVRLLDLSTRRWLPPPPLPTASSSAPAPRPRHAHLSCISSNHLYIFGGRDILGDERDDVWVCDLDKMRWIQKERYPRALDASRACAATSRWHALTPPLSPLRPGATASSISNPLPYSEPATPDSPCDIYLYKVRRALDVLSLLTNGELKISPARTAQPPSLRFPSGAVLGNTVILAGNYSAASGLAIWTLDLTTKTWTHIDTGELLKHGSWTNGHLWHPHNKFFVFGKRNKTLASIVAAAADQLVIEWDDVAVVDMEALGIYQPPAHTLDLPSQRRALAVLANEQRADFAFVCEDGRQIPCVRATVAARWPWLEEQLSRVSGASAGITSGKRTTITVRQTSCTLAVSYPVTHALLQYFYSLALGTALQRAPAVLSHLLLVATEFRIPYLQALALHAMHLALSEATAAGVFEVAASCGCRSLQIR
ncbi:galactose oxidase [Mycena pura]|uniref:Galactose oxidase n=1 Tax=Mycena pura TaxID=153505 RepID=A0AAD6V7P3_9AGAR|nr:galactose oxidase [Mycena pura]